MQIDVNKLKARWNDNKRNKRHRFYDEYPELVKLYQHTFVNAQYVYDHTMVNPIPLFDWFEGGGMQVPSDYLAYIEVICKHDPRVIIETGTLSGACAKFYCEVLERNHKDRNFAVVTVELMPQHVHQNIIDSDKNIKSFLGSSIDPSVLELMKQSYDNSLPTMVTLDSAHDANHVIEEIALYAPLVSVGQYLIVQDTFIGCSWGGSVYPLEAKAAVDRGDMRAFDYHESPLGAVEALLDEYGEFFEIDLSKQRWILCQSPFGFLKRIK